MLIATFSKRNNLCYITFWRGLPQLRIPPVINSFEICYIYWQFQLKIPLGEIFTPIEIRVRTLSILFTGALQRFTSIFYRGLHIITLFTEPLMTLFRGTIIGTITSDSSR